MLNKPKDTDFTRSYFDIEEVEIREDDGKKTIAGYAATFEKLSVPMYGFREKIKAGAFAESIRGGEDIKSLWNHNSDFVLGSTKAGTLRLSEDAKGLRFELDAPDTTVGKDAVISISRGDVSGMSFGFNVRKQEWDEKDEKNVVRTLIDIDLREVSPTPFPAYPSTKVGVRTVEDDYIEHLCDKDELKKRDAENILKLRKLQLTLLEKEC